MNQIVQLKVFPVKNNATQAQPVILAKESVIFLNINGRYHATLLATETDLEDLAYGVLITQSVIEDISAISACRIQHMDEAIELDVHIEESKLVKREDFNKGNRLQKILHPSPVHSQIQITSEQLYAGFRTLEAKQKLRDQTGATHAAAFLDENGQFLLLREDVGRHNALDKLIGALLKQKISLHRGSVLVTSRASYEMVQKCIAANIGVLAAISAPTSLAVHAADQAQITLIGFAREPSYTIYTHNNRVRSLHFL